MDTKTVFIVVLLMVLCLVWYSTASKRNKILCHFRRINKTKVERLVPMKSRYVIFDGGRYKIDTGRITLFWYARGVNALFPTWIPSLDFSWYSDVPHNPDDFKDTWDTPEARNAASSEDDWIGFNRAARTQAAGKASKLRAYLPWLLIAGVAIAVYYLFVRG